MEGRTGACLGEAADPLQEIGDQATLILQDSDEAEQVDLPERYGGITFKSDGTFRQSYWRKCGNDTSPGYSDGKWELDRTKTSLIIRCETQWAGTFKVLKLTKDVMVIERVD